MFLGRTGIWTDFCGGKDSGHHSPSLRQHTIQKHLKIVFLFLFLPLPFLLYSCFNRSLRRFTLLLSCFASPHTNFASLPLNVSKASSPSTLAFRHQIIQLISQRQNIMIPSLFPRCIDRNAIFPRKHKKFPSTGNSNSQPCYQTHDCCTGKVEQH